MTTTISSKGQITVPIEIRRALALRAGVKLKIRLGKNSDFIVTKAADDSFFRRFQGMAKSHAPWKSGDDARDKLRGPIMKSERKMR
jgi:AbrB family looped-hinge helix DNA binding protein